MDVQALQQGMRVFLVIYKTMGFLDKSPAIMSSFHYLVDKLSALGDINIRDRCWKRTKQ